MKAMSSIKTYIGGNEVYFPSPSFLQESFDKGHQSTLICAVGSIDRILIAALSSMGQIGIA